MRDKGRGLRHPVGPRRGMHPCHRWPATPLPPWGGGAPPPARRGGRRSGRTIDFIQDLAGRRRGCHGVGTPRILHRYRHSGAGGSGSSHRYAHACTCPCAPRCAHAHTHRAKPPTQPRAPRTPQPSPVPWGASAAPGREWWRVAGSHQHGVGPAGPCSPSVLQGQEGPAPHRAPRGREGEKELCPAGG